MVKFRDSKRESYITLDCATCLLDSSASYLKLALNQGSNLNKGKDLSGVQALLAQLQKDFCPETSPNEIAQTLFHMVIDKANIRDPWKEIRDKSNSIALEVIPAVIAQLNSIPNPKLSLIEAFVWSVVGNNLDFGTSGHQVTLHADVLREAYQKFKLQGFSINHFDEFWDLLLLHKSCLYICDNAGEIAFDAQVIKQMKSLGIEVTVVVKGGPISNDALLDDAIQVGLDKICPIITTGSPELGFFPYTNSKEFLDKLNRSPLVICKGQANWKACYAYQDQLSPQIQFFNVLKLKCNVHAQLFGLPKGSNLFYHLTSTDFRS